MEMLDGEENIVQEETPHSELTEKIATELYTVVCRNGGAMDVVKAMSALGPEGVAYVSQYGFFPLLQSSIQNVLKLEYVDFGHGASRTTLRAVVNVELCTDYKKSKCSSPECARLHVCSFYVRGDCSFGERCRYRHDFMDNHEEKLLKEHKLSGLDHSSLLTVLRQAIFGSDSSSVDNAQVCPQYNSVPGCSIGSACPKLHLCSWFVKGTCKKGIRCDKSHALAEENSRILSQQLHNVARVFNFQMGIRQATGMRPKPPTIDEICGFHLKGGCAYGRFCQRHWYDLPYLWQIKVSWADGGDKWFNFPSMFNQKIEYDFCDVGKDTSVEIKITDSDSLHCIHFEDMVAKDEVGNKSVSIRRLSTASWLNASAGDSYATHWTWYWLNDSSQWIAYDGGGCDLRNIQDRCDSSNEKLEESLLSGVETFNLTINQKEYSIDLKNFVQKNTTTGKTRKLRRRPTKFIGKQDLCGIASSRTAERPPHSASLQGNVSLPNEWTPMTDDQEVVTVLLDSSSEQYCQGQREFLKTMNGRTIHKIDRIQNVDLWESYSRKFSKLSRKLGTPPEVRHLFHGTSETSAKAICQQGFDWRLCGVHGTAYGKGSYFAVNASYSDGYTSSSPNGHKLMFLSKVIVGSFVVGSSNTVRPPPMNQAKPHVLHCSCVDNQNNPTIFVIFDNDQAYPELLISYS